MQAGLGDVGDSLIPGFGWLVDRCFEFGIIH
jgi:hypothetical protein